MEKTITKKRTAKELAAKKLANKKPGLKSTRIQILDTTLRDGGQTAGVDFSLSDKKIIAHALDDFGFDYIEAGWPGANAIENRFFEAPPPLYKSRLVAFGMTRRANHSAGNDPGLAQLQNSPALITCIVGKSWDFQVSEALQIPLEENLCMIGESIAHLAKSKEEVIFDAEHFFDGYKSNPGYALDCLKKAEQNGARWMVLCDTNGGTLPDEVGRIVDEITPHIPGEKLGIHTHNDTGNAVANSLVALQRGVCHLQGTLNGLGERCGNANLVTLIPTLVLKTDLETGLKPEKLPELTKLSRLLDDRLNRGSDASAPYVGENAFTHKAGLHASGVARNPATYEHIDPSTVGNMRIISMSNQAGRANLVTILSNYGISVEGVETKKGKQKEKQQIGAQLSKAEMAELLETLKEREAEGYSYEGANASLELLLRRRMGQVPHYFKIKRFRVIDERRLNNENRIIAESEATVILEHKKKETVKLAFGLSGPVNALDTALREALLESYPILEKMQLVDYKVRIIPPRKDSTGTDAVTRVIIESVDDKNHHWSTIGVSSNIIAASMEALDEAYHHFLYSSQTAPE